MVVRMKTTLDIADPLFRDAKRRAAEEGITLRALVERALRAHLAGKPGAKRRRYRWHVVRGRALPAVPIEDRDRLFDFLDGLGGEDG